MVASVGVFGSDYIINKNAHLTGGKICTRIEKNNEVSSEETPKMSSKAFKVISNLTGDIFKNNVSQTNQENPSFVGLDRPNNLEGFTQDYKLKFAQSLQYDSQAMENLYNKMYVEKVDDPVQAYMDEHNIVVDYEEEYQKHIVNSGCKDEAELQVLNTCGYPTKTMLQGTSGNKIMQASLAAKDNGFISQEESLTNEERQKIVSVADMKDLVKIVKTHEDECCVEIKNLMDKLVSSNNIEDELKQKLTKISNALSTMITNGTWGKDPNANIAKYNSSLISNYAS